MTSPATDGSPSRPRQLVELTAGSGQPPALRLRAYRDDDLDALCRAFEDPQVRRWNPGPPSVDLEAVRQWGVRRNDWSDGSHASWAVADDPGTLLGSVSVYQVDHEHGDAEVGYWLAPWGRGRGVATAAVNRAAAYAFAELGVHRLRLMHSVENPASCAVAARTGFVLEGHLRRSHRFPDGRHHDEHLHARLADDPDGPLPPP